MLRRGQSRRKFYAPEKGCRGNSLTNQFQVVLMAAPKLLEVLRHLRPRHDFTRPVDAVNQNTRQLVHRRAFLSA